MKKFFKRNAFLILSNLLLLTAIFIYKIVLTPVLIHNFNFMETVLNIGNIGFCLGWVLGILFLNQIFKYKFNFFKLGSFMFSIQATLIFIEFLLIIGNNYNDYCQWFYIPLRAAEGFTNQIIISLITNLLTYKMITNDKNASINGIISSLSYLIKFVMPIIGAILILPAFPLAIMAIPLSIYIYLFFMFNIKEKILLREYHKYMMKKITNKKDKFKKINFLFLKETMNIYSLWSSFFKNKNNKKIYFIIVSFINGKIRVFYDFYLILMLISFNFSLKESTFVLSMMMAGMALHFITGFLSEKINYIKLQTTGFICLLSLFIYILIKDVPSYIDMIIISFLMGFLRTFNWNWDHKFIIENYKSLNQNIDQFKTLLKLNIETGTIIGYATGILVFTLYSFKGIIIECIIGLIILIITSLYFRKDTI